MEAATEDPVAYDTYKKNWEDAAEKSREAQQ
jgi:hypothetical protein